MHCTFEIDGEPPTGWAEDRRDLPLYQGRTVVHDGHAYEIVAEPRYQADGESLSIRASFLVKPTTIIC
jgi:hypothetical protein